MIAAFIETLLTFMFIIWCVVFAVVIAPTFCFLAKMLKRLIGEFEDDDEIDM